MPAYDFRCTSCGNTVEISLPQGSTHEDPCSHCGAPMKRVFTPVGVVFKGSGFHNTDYKSKPKEKPAVAGCDSAGSKSACDTCPAKSGSNS